jgi:hypothetical protein
MVTQELVAQEKAWRKRRQEKVLSTGGIVLAFQILLRML